MNTQYVHWLIQHHTALIQIWEYAERNRLLDEYMKEYQERTGYFTDEELTEADRILGFLE